MTASQDQGIAGSRDRRIADREPWRAFLQSSLLAAAAALAFGLGFVLVLDPYGLRVRPGRPPTALMDVNQRYMYPQLARSGLYDSAIFGTSTIRLLDPERLNQALGGRFVNLGLNAGTPWEQLELARLFLRHVPRPRTLVFGLDRTWCEPDADAKRLTFRAFPPWLYGESRLGDLPHLLNLKSFEIAGRVALHGLGLMPARIRRDGYEVFTPPEASYDLARARGHIYGPGDDALALASPQVGDRPRFPALDWLAALVREVPTETRIAFLLPPVHVVSQAAPGTPAEAWEAACKARIAALARERGGPALDFRFPSSLTGTDENYWDKLHYREPVAGLIVEALRDALAGRAPSPGDPVRHLTGHLP